MPQYKINVPLNGIEIYFDVKPDELVLQKLREGKWRWHNGKKCWYNKIGEVTMQFANDICTPLPNFQSMFPPKQPSINNETAPQTTSYNLVSDGNILSHVTITKNGKSIPLPVQTINSFAAIVIGCFPFMLQVAHFADVLLNIYFKVTSMN